MTYVEMKKLFDLVNIDGLENIFTAQMVAAMDKEEFGLKAPFFFDAVACNLSVRIYRTLVDTLCVEYTFADSGTDEVWIYHRVDHLPLWLEPLAKRLKMVNGELMITINSEMHTIDGIPVPE